MCTGFFDNGNMMIAKRYGIKYALKHLHATTITLQLFLSSISLAQNIEYCQ
jgi:hypothetical protein